MYFSCNILLYFILCFWFRTRAAATQTDKCVESPCYYKQLHPDSYHVPSVHSYSPSVHSYSPSVLSESHTMARTDHFIFFKISRSPEVFSLHNEGNVLESWNFSVFILFFFFSIWLPHTLIYSGPWKEKFFQTKPVTTC